MLTGWHSPSAKRHFLPQPIRICRRVRSPRDGGSHTTSPVRYSGGTAAARQLGHRRLYGAAAAAAAAYLQRWLHVCRVSVAHRVCVLRVPCLHCPVALPAGSIHLVKTRFSDPCTQCRPSSRQDPGLARASKRAINKAVGGLLIDSRPSWAVGTAAIRPLFDSHSTAIRPLRPCLHVLDCCAATWINK